MNREEALQEYFFSQEKIDSIDEKTLRFKEWNITIASAAIGGALIESNGYIALLAVLSSVGFWLMEGWWKEKQRVFEKRAAALEESLRKDQSEIEGPNISSLFLELYEPVEQKDHYYRLLWSKNTIKKHWFPKRLTYVSVFMLPATISLCGLLTFCILSPEFTPSLEAERALQDVDGPSPLKPMQD